MSWARLMATTEGSKTRSRSLKQYPLVTKEAAGAAKQLQQQHLQHLKATRDDKTQAQCFEVRNWSLAKASASRRGVQCGVKRYGVKSPILLSTNYNSY